MKCGEVWCLTTESCTTLSSGAEYKPRTAACTVSHLNIREITVAADITTPTSNTTNTPANFMKQNKSSSSNSNSVVMPEEITDSPVAKTLEEKILKLKELIVDSSNSSNQNQLEKREKLQQKLRYLEYYQSYDLGACPE